MNYSYLRAETSPKILVNARKLLGTSEVIGDKNNPVIMQWAKDLNLQSIYVADSVPWCGLFMAHVCKVSELEIPKMPLRAKEWLNFGTKQEHAMLGDVLVFSRTGGGHVGIYVGEDTNCFHVLGGNQGDRVSIVRIDKTRCIGVRRTKWKVSQPKNVRKLFLPDVGFISKNER
jgi:uncharacterized protein (TIGR02594 family)